jgi:hypothetical protein
MDGFDDGVYRRSVVQRGHTDEHVDMTDRHEVVQQLVGEEAVAGHTRAFSV